MRIILINPNMMKPPVTPIAFDYIAAACKNAGINIDLIDCCIESDWKEKLTRLLKDPPTLVGVSIRNIDDSYFASRDFTLKRMVPVIETAKKLTDAPICLGGVGFSIFPRETLEFCNVNYGICGEGEEAIVNLAQAFEGRFEMDEVPGLIRLKNGTVEKNPSKPVALNSMDLSSRSFVNNNTYFKTAGQVGFETKRGCSMSCNYCPEPFIRGREVRLRDPENVAKELTNLYHKGIDVFHTCDSEFNSPYSHSVLVSKAIIDAGLGEKIKWYAYCSPECFTDELASLMSQAGCVGIDFGADHGDNNMLARLGHQYSAEDLVKIRDLCTKYNLICMYDLLLGSPGDTREGIEKTILLMKKVTPDRVGISLGIRVYPATPLGKMILKESRSNLADNPSLFGELEGNETLLKPVYYCDADLGEDVEAWLHGVIGDDPRFLMGRRTDANLNYNYNDNPELSNAIKKGHRGAFWDILRRVSEGIAPL